MFWNLFWYIITWIATDLLTPAPEVEDAQARALGDTPFPTASQDRPLPVIFGTTWIDGPNTLWHGDIEIKPDKRKACSGTIFKKCTSYIAGYFFNIGLQCGLCHGPLDSLLAIKIGEDLIWEGDENDDTIYIDKPNLWGGRDGDGGVKGYIDIQPGSDSQPQNTYMTTQIDSDIPAYRGMVVITFNKFYWGMSKNPAKPAFLVKVIPKSLGVTYAEISGQANPAHMIYELLVSAAYGSAMPSYLIDTTSFVACAATLYNEGMGLKLSWQNQMKVGDVIKSLEKIANAKIYPDYATGKITMKLIRADFDIETLPVLDESNILTFSNMSRPLWFETVNEVICTYNETGETANVEKPGVAQDLGNLHIQQGQRVSASLNYPQIPTATVASVVAQTELRQLSFPLLKVTLEVNRDGLTLTPGTPFILNRPSRNIINQVMRVGKWEEDDLLKSTIKIDAIQDIYGLAGVVYATTTPSYWVPPSLEAENVVNSREDQMPYMLAVSDQSYQSSNPIVLGYDVYYYAPRGIPWLFVEDPTKSTLDFSLLMGFGTDYLEEEINQTFSDRATLTTAIDQTDNSLTLTGTVLTTSPNGDQALGSTLILLGDELISYGLATDNTDGTFTLTGVERGLLDTVPDSHAVGAEIWLDAFADGVRPETSFLVDDTINVKYITRALHGKLAEGSASAHELTFTNRTARPYPVGDIEVNSGTYDSTFASGPAVLTWAERNKHTQVDAIATQSAPTVTPEDDTVYTLKIYDRDDILLRTENNLTGTSYTYTEVNELIDNGLTTLEPKLTFVMQTDVNSKLSWQDQSITVYRTDVTPT